jgi:hypothetical protein
MKAKLNLTKAGQAIALCAGLLVGGAVWATCAEDSAAADAAESDLSQADVASTPAGARSASLMETRLYEYLHDVDIHKVDTLGDYGNE